MNLMKHWKRFLGVTLLLILINSSFFGMEKIKLATLNWPPFYAEDLEKQGIFSEISREAFKRAGYELEIVFVPWKRAVELAKQGRYDGLLGAYINEERKQHQYYTDKVAENNEVFIEAKDSMIEFESMDDIRGYNIGGLSGGAPLKELEAEGFEVSPVTSDYQSLFQLNAGRVDLVVMGEFHFYEVIEKEAKSLKGNFHILDKPYKSYGLYCTISKKKSNGKIIVEKFNQALEEMKKDGTYDRIYKEFGFTR